MTSVWATGRGEARLDALLAESFPAARTLDMVLTPLPVNPVCREVMTAQVVADRYVVRSGTHSLLPAWLSASRCAELRLSGTSTAPLVAMAEPSTDEMAWIGELSIPRELPATLARDYCAVERPVAVRPRSVGGVPQGDGWLVGDLRYDREPELGFAEIEVGPATTSARPRPPWVPPRQDLLDMAPPG